MLNLNDNDDFNVACERIHDLDEEYKRHLSHWLLLYAIGKATKETIVQQVNRAVNNQGVADPF